MEIQKYLEHSRMVNLVNNVVALVFEDDEYMPEYYEYSFWVSVSSYYAGIGPEMTVDEFMQKLYLDGWKKELEDAINPDQLDAIRVAITERIDARLHKSPFEPLAKAVTEFIGMLNNDINLQELKGLMKAVKEMKEINADSLVEAVIKNQK